MLIGLSVLTVALDQLTKVWILSDFRVGNSIPVVPGFFNLTYIQNTGAAFGIFASAEPAFRIPFFTGVPLVALFAIGTVFRRLPATELRLSSALSLVIGGAVGNFLDRARWSHVIDFLDFHWNHLYHFPAFNVADSAICVGVILLLIDLVRVRNLNVSTSV